MWTALTTKENDNVTKYHIETEDNKALSFREVIDLWVDALSFRQFFTDTLKNSSYKGYFWEVKPITSSTLDEAFEFVLVNSSTLPGLTAEKHFFEKYFSGESVVSFPNLRGDAQLVVPTDKSTDNNYTHLAEFVRHAPPEQVDEFWQVVAKMYRKSIGEAPKWLSTAGLGVYWLHVRIDTRPKYYRYLKYKSTL